MKISQKLLQLLVIELIPKARHHAVAVERHSGYAVIVRRSAAGQILLPIQSEEAWPVQVAGVIRIVAACAQLLIFQPPLRLLGS